MIKTHWNVVNNLTNILYILIIIFLPISPIWSTVFLFAIVGIWSRIPGTSTAAVGDWLLLLDLVDMFSMIIAINLGGLKGALFVIVVNFVSGATGEYTNWFFVLKDSIALSLSCLTIPYVHMLTGNIVVTISLFTLIRSFWYFPMQLFIPYFELPAFLGVMFVWTIGLYTANVFYARLFGSFFDSLLKTGVDFSWSLFILVSIIIFGVKAYRKFFRREYSRDVVDNTHKSNHKYNLYRMS